jgi:hypothetical protein
MGTVLVAAGRPTLPGVLGATMTSTLRATAQPKSGELLELPLSISVFDHEVAALDVTELTQSLTERLL